MNEMKMQTFIFNTKYAHITLENCFEIKYYHSCHLESSNSTFKVILL